MVLVITAKSIKKRSRDGGPADSMFFLVHTSARGAWPNQTEQLATNQSFEHQASKKILPRETYYRENFQPFSLSFQNFNLGGLRATISGGGQIQWFEKI